MPIPLRPLLTTSLLVVLFGCGENNDARPTNNITDQKLVDGLAPSARTLDEAIAYVKSGTTTDELHSYLQTIPALVREGRFHWMLKDGSLWTDFVMTEKGAVIQGYDCLPSIRSTEQP